MATANRSSNTEMVSVQATIESLEEAYAGDSALDFMNDAAQLLRQFKSISTLEHQGEPVGEVVAFGKGLHEIAWAAGRMPGLGAKLYTHPTPADPGEVERLSSEIAELLVERNDLRAELETARENHRKHAARLIDERGLLRAQLAELPEKLIAAIDREQERLSAEDYLMDSDDRIKVIREAVSASAEPSEDCDHCAGAGHDYYGEKCAHCMPSAPVERDERAEFEAAYCEYFNALPSVSTPITPEQVKDTREGDHYGHGSLGKNLRWAGWQMRAALEGKL